MGKRTHPHDGDGARKRPRMFHDTPTFEEITSGRQLMQLLIFDQDVKKARHGLQSFKVLLDRINDPEKRTAEDVSILHSYLQATKPRDETSNDNDNDGNEESEAVYLADIMDMWAYAAAVDNGGILSAVPVVLSLLLKYLSYVLELVPIGLGIGRTLLQQKRLDLIARNLSSDRAKEFIVSPTLRLLREVLSFDGGVLAKSVFRCRNHTFRYLPRNLSLRFTGDGAESEGRTSVRTNAMRFFLDALKYLHAEGKTELINQRDVVAALNKHIKDDPPMLIRQLLDTLWEHVAKDDALMRSTKSRIFNSFTISHIGSLYSYSRPEFPPPGQPAPTPISDAAHQFLMRVCTSPKAGVLRPQHGCYPRGLEPDTSSKASAAKRKASQTQSLRVDVFSNEVPIHNQTLSDLLTTLRPWSSTRQCELVLAIFRQAPELISWYFVNKKAFTFEPKISATWIGYAALLFGTIQVDLPAYFGSRHKFARVPPPTSILVDSILPLPLTQKIFLRCLTHSSKLVPFFAMRLLVISLEKLRTALQMHANAALAYPDEALWPESARKVVGEFCRRCPPVQDVFNAYRGIPSDDLLFREVTSRALRLLYEVVPEVALLPKLDVSSALFTVLRQVEQRQGSSQDQAMKMLELDNLLAIAGYSPGMRWFSKTEGLALSPFAALLKIYSEAPRDLVLGKVRSTLDFVATEQQLMADEGGEVEDGSDDDDSGDSGDSLRGLGGLVNSLKQTATTDSSELSDPIWAFVDNCLGRCAGAPIKYAEMIRDLVQEGPMPFDPITMALSEQLPFAIASASASADEDEDGLLRLASFMANYLSCCTGEEKALKKIYKTVVAAFPEGSKAAATLPKKLKRSRPSKSGKVVTEKEGQRKADGDENSGERGERGEHGFKGFEDRDEQLPLQTLLDMGPIEELDNSALSRWVNKSAQEIVEDGHATALIMLLASEHLSIRREAVVNLAKMAVKIQESTYDEREQVWLLLSELVNAAKAQLASEQYGDRPLPSHILAFACHAVEVLQNPLHCLYEPVNVFLTSGPAWRLHAFPLVTEITTAEREDPSYYPMVKWLLQYLFDSLRTTTDVGHFRTQAIFERLLALASNPYMHWPLRRQVLRILCRAASLDDGSTTLATRTGVFAWLEMEAQAWQEDDDGNDDPESSKAPPSTVVQSLVRELWTTCDQDRVTKWSKNALPASIGIRS